MPDTIIVAIGTADEKKSTTLLKGFENKHILVSRRPERYNIPDEKSERQKRIEDIKNLIMNYKEKIEV